MREPPLSARPAASAAPGIVVAALVVTAGCWIATVYGARAMAGSMHMPGGWAMSMTWMAMPGQSAAAAALMFLSMWEVMMVAMMLPSALPMVLLVRGLRAARPQESALLLAGYFIVWLAFGVVAYALGLGVVTAAMRSEAVSRVVPPATAVALVLAGAYQCTPWKRACLAHCRRPLSFLMTGWRPGAAGALALGVRHGAYCAACCWALMAMQLVIGVMNLPLMAAVAGVIFVEKVWRHGEALAIVVGMVSVVVGLVLLVAPLMLPAH